MRLSTRLANGLSTISGVWRHAAQSFEELPEFRHIELPAYTRELLDRPVDDLPDTDQQLAVEQLRRLLLEELFPNTIHSARSRRLSAVHASIHRGRPLAALCLSGGGIRSASFSLGVLQAFAGAGWLDFFDYLSTVSGGGYIGSWLSAWIAHDGKTAAQRGLAEVSTERLLAPEAPPIRHIRTYANYLSPRLGIMSVDTWTLAATYLRNLLLEWLVLVPLLVAVVLVPWIAVSNVNAPETVFRGYGLRLGTVLVLLGTSFGVLAVAFIHRTRPDATGRRDVTAIPSRQRSTSAFVKWCLLPLIVSMACLTTALVWAMRWNILPDDRVRMWAAVGVGAGIHTLGFVAALATSIRKWKPNRWRKTFQTIGELALIILSGGGAGWLAYELMSRPGASASPRLYVWLAAPVFMLLVTLASFVFTGLESRESSDEEREWTARFGAWILLPVVVWLVLAGVVLFGPQALLSIRYGALASSALALLSGGAVAKFGSSSRSPARKGDPRGAGIHVPPLSVRLALEAGAVLFLAILIAGLSLGGLILSAMLGCLRLGACLVSPSWTFSPIDTTAAFVLSLVFGLLMARFIDTNRFSLHAMYRSRLIRTFLGASRRAGERVPDPFTGFDERDDVPMNTLGKPPRVQRPLHVVNMALNLVSGTNLAWRDRKARSFTASPLHAGSVGLGYRAVRPTSSVPQRLYGGQRGMMLGTAMTISGAAASPNMGYHSSPLVTFLMTFFNVRLGWWLGNPGPAGDTTFHRMQPTYAVRPIIDEMFGRTDDRNAYVYLSDGGHFDNLGLYEMILRRCQRIVVVDASCDADGSFDDLANAIRLVSVDLGIPITFPEFDVRVRGRGSYYAVADIAYGAIDSGAPTGKLCYIKPGLHGNEPRDVLSYAHANRAFPHEPTSDQFFSEAQFESYRSLGHHIAHTLIEDLSAKTPAPAYARLPF